MLLSKVSYTVFKVKMLFYEFMLSAEIEGMTLCCKQTLSSGCGYKLYC